jgi:hypothetical protein
MDEVIIEKSESIDVLQKYTIILLQITKNNSNYVEQIMDDVISKNQKA